MKFKLLATMLLGGTVLIVPPRGSNNSALSLDGLTYGFRGSSDTSIIITPEGTFIDDDNGSGQHTTVGPDLDTTFTDEGDN